MGWYKGVKREIKVLRKEQADYKTEISHLKGANDKNKREVDYLWREIKLSKIRVKKAKIIYNSIETDNRHTG